MNVFITGGTGFIGRHLVFRLAGTGGRITVLTRSTRGADMFPPDVTVVEGDPTRPGPWQKAVEGRDAIINLAGTSIFRRWTGEAKRQIRESRISTTRNIVDAMLAAGAERATLFSASAVGYYGFHGDEELTEASGPGDDFLALVARDWEKEALRAERPQRTNVIDTPHRAGDIPGSQVYGSQPAPTDGVRVVIPRFGIVLGRSGGAMAVLEQVFRLFLGGPLGHGRQWMSWIHVDDLVEAFLFLMERPEAAGPVNFTAPYPVRNRDFAVALGRALRRPAVMPAPGFAVRLIMGELGTTLLNGQRVKPEKLLKAGFQFRYPTIEAALREIISS